ncbi:MAG: thioredoxin [Spirosomaceae bacterium]|nr:thioredoxin [Spirosomataceae bacterium]
MMKVLATCILFIATVSLSNAQGITFEHDKSWNDIVQKAKAENKLIFMDAYTVWCGPCKALQARVFPDKELGEYFNANFINAKIDMERGEGPALASKFRVRAYPTLFFIDPNTQKVVVQAMGYRQIEDLMQIGKQAAAKKSI